ncbi:hypothetical protein G4Y79_02755 [Phototrophicus methaneseepsis]|uniref:Cytochrome c-552/4 domain-containing protein n=1 Tax=Phototrophicus methaneseepsis TaxID=2710758 RepID=A0A7S8EAF3_9CHLR|nr:hypothetical protein [Phototrophicus methaneseepsis]QPC83315.1 hypothetical protein G4Y79_02755 [Phototrophicus methaneseepsis]
MSSKQKVTFLIPVIAIAGLFGIILLTPQDEQIIARGIVHDESGPLEGAVVRQRGSSYYVLTNSDGYFELPLPENNGAQITAWIPGTFIGGGDVEGFLNPEGDMLFLHHYPVTDNSEYPFVSPTDPDNETACANCHADHTGENDSAMPFDEWQQDAHATAATNKRFLSLYNGTNLAGEAGPATLFIYEALQTANKPVAPSLGQDAVGPGYKLDYPDQSGICATCHTPILAIDTPYHADPNTAVGVAAEGISCDFCHKIQDVTLRPDGKPDPGLPGVLSVQFLRPQAGEQLFIGPLDDTPGEDIYAASQDESQFCAACHSGQFWDVPIYDSFGEWLASPYSMGDQAQTCQDCHMPHVGVTSFVQLPPDDTTILAPRDPETIFSHRMPGAADEALLESAATLTVEAKPTGDQLHVTVRVTNTGAGHHIPTDNPLRNMILLVQTVDGEGQPLTLLDGPTIPAWGGVGDPAEGYYAGQPGILYAKILADLFTDEMPTYAYWRPTRLVSDNRIAALATDQSSYTFALPADQDVTVDVQLYLRRAYIELMDLKDWDTTDMLMTQQIVRVP